MDFDPDHPDVVIVVGGDGTFLRAIQEYIDQIDNLMFVGVKEGSLGFYTDYLTEEIDELLRDLSLEEYKTHTFRLIESKINNHKFYSINEARIENPFHTLIANIYVNDVFFETYRGNGLCVSSTLGSSAYNKSLGGSVVVPGLEVLQLVGIAPINNRVYHSFDSPLVLPGNVKIRIEGDFSDAVVGYDHLTSTDEPQDLLITLSDKCVTIIYKKDHSFISHLHEAFIK